MRPLMIFFIGLVMGGVLPPLFNITIVKGLIELSVLALGIGMGFIIMIICLVLL